MYLWNSAISEAFQTSIHFAEITCRNAIHKALLYHAGDKWYEHPTFLKLLDHRFERELRDAVYEETQQHGDDLLPHHIVSALTFGFWEHLTTKRFQRMLWPKGIRYSFPGAPNGRGREDLRTLIEEVRRWRNRIAHHRAIFDKGPSHKHQRTLELIRWVCPISAAYVAGRCRVHAAIASRPVHA
jgi:Abi-like protein.